MKPRILYTVAELAKLAGMSTKRALRVFTEAGVPIQRYGKLREVWLSDLREHLPEFWDSAMIHRKSS